MAEMYWHAPAPLPAQPAPDLGAEEHRSRSALNRTLADPTSEEAWAELIATYHDMAAEWDDWVASQPTYLEPVAAGLARVGKVERAVEVGCGSGQASSVLAGHAGQTVAIDINLAMLRRAPDLPRVAFVAADVRRLPFADGSIQLLLGLNAVPAVDEFRRVLASDGRLLWCSSFGPGTPLYVQPDRLLVLLGAGWCGEAGRAGHGDWALFTRR